MQFLIDNRSTVVSPDDCAKLATGVERAAILFASAWGFRPPMIDLCDAGDDSASATRVIVVDDDPSRAGELGDHSEDSDGAAVVVVLAKLVTDAGGGVLDGGSIGISVASVVCHEVFETLVDFSCNDWVFDGRNFLAKETADPVEGAPGFPVTLDDGTEILCSNGVLPRYFDPLAPEGSQLDLAGLCSTPFQLLPGGYQIVMDPAGNVNQVFGTKRAAVLEKMRGVVIGRRRRRHAKIERARALAKGWIRRESATSPGKRGVPSAPATLPNLPKSGMIDPLK